jgi:phage FluMu protein Com
MFDSFNEFRCPACNKLIFKYRLKGSLSVEVKCTRCNKVASLVIGRMVSSWES